MARTKTYKRQVAAKINTINRKLRGIERTFGTDSEQYQRYINAASAALPTDAYTLADSGRLTIHKNAESIGTLKLGQLKALSKLPTAKRSMDQSKKALAQNRLRAAGVQSPGTDEIKQQARAISDEEALEELAAKAIIQGMENEKGKLKYDEEATGMLKEKGSKTYTQLLDILRRGKEIRRENERREAKREYMREYRQRNKERRAEYQREYRRRNREEVNRKQREYRQRRATEERIKRQTAERERNSALRRRP